jgi:hypothetical protein
LIQYVFTFVQLISDVLIVIKSSRMNHLERVAEQMLTVRKQLVQSMEAFNNALSRATAFLGDWGGWYIPGLASGFDTVLRFFHKLMAAVAEQFDMSWMNDTIRCEGSRGPSRLLTTTVSFVFT